MSFTYSCTSQQIVKLGVRTVVSKISVFKEKKKIGSFVIKRERGLLDLRPNALYHLLFGMQVSRLWGILFYLPFDPKDLSLERANLLSIINVLGVQTSITNTSIKLSNKIDFLVFSWPSTMMRSRMTVLWQLEEM